MLGVKEDFRNKNFRSFLSMNCLTPHRHTVHRCAPHHMEARIRNGEVFLDVEQTVLFFFYYALPPFRRGMLSTNDKMFA